MQDLPDIKPCYGLKKVILGHVVHKRVSYELSISLQGTDVKLIGL